MKRIILLAFVAGAVVAVAVALPLVASAGDQHRFVLTERMQLTSFDPATGEGTQAGTFAAAGAVNDAGLATVVFRISPGEGGCGLITGPHTFTGSGGSITVLTTADICPFPPPNPPRSFVRGIWRIVGATGSYTGLHGHGNVFATADFTNGQITIARDGEVERGDSD